MTFLRFAAVLAFAGPLTAQTFILMSDPQFGMYTKDQSFVHETANFEFAIATANRLQPAFVVVTGDLVNASGSTAQVAEYKRIAAKLSPGIQLFSMPGNHDVENEPTKETLARYRERFGPDYYTFRNGDIAGFVLDTSLIWRPKNIPGEDEAMEKWLRAELEKARRDGVKHLIVYQHIPFFLTDPDEPDQYFNIPTATRKRYLKLLHEFGVHYVFAGHLHHNSEGHDGDLQMISSGPVGMPLEHAKSGMRIAIATPTGVSHKYYDFGDLPDAIDPAKPLP